MNWLVMALKAAGANFPFSAGVVQLQSDLETEILSQRMNKLEEPIIHLHHDIPSLSKKIYESMYKEDSNILEFDDVFYNEYSRPLAVLDKSGYIKKMGALGSHNPIAIKLIDPTYIMYMCAISGDNDKMDDLLNIVDQCKINQWLYGNKLKEEIGLPECIIKAVFEIYVSKGYGLLSKEIGSCAYVGTT